jgi:hypothetical protein
MDIEMKMMVRMLREQLCFQCRQPSAQHECLSPQFAMWFTVEGDVTPAGRGISASGIHKFHSFLTIESLHLLCKKKDAEQNIQQ